MENRISSSTPYFGRYALFTDPLSKTGGEKMQLPDTCYLPGTSRELRNRFTEADDHMVIDECRIMKWIQTESKDPAHQIQWW